MGCNWEEGRYTPVSARDLHGVPQGLKPAGLLAWDGTTEVVPFPQSVWWDERLVCRRLVGQAFGFRGQARWFEEGWAGLISQ